MERQHDSVQHRLIYGGNFLYRRKRVCVLAGRFQSIALNAEPDPFGGLAPTTLPHSAASTMCEN